MTLYGRTISAHDAAKIALLDQPFYENSGGGVTLSGGEPMLQLGFVQEFFKLMQNHGVHTALDTCGAVPWQSFEKIKDVTDLFLYDLKHMDYNRHQELTGKGNRSILYNLQKLVEAKAAIEVRLPLIPGMNDDAATLLAMGELLGTLDLERVRVLPYHALAGGKYESLGMINRMPETKAPTDKELDHAVGILQQFGVNAVSGRD
jgi:pyruvate formate lyase activating enzyme